VKKWGTYLLLLIIGLSIWLRFHDLYADPPKNLTNSAGGYFDGYDNSHAARSYILFEDLRPDEWDPVLYSPPFVLLQILWFKIFPPGIVSINSFSAFFSTISFLLGVLCFRRFGFKGICLSAMLLGFFYPWVHFSRVAMFENIMIFFMALTMLCLGWTRLTVGRAFGVGAFAVLAYASKATAIYFLPTAFLAVALACWQGYFKNSEWKVGLKVMGGYAGGSLLTLTPWLLLFRIPDAEQIAFYGKQWKKLALPTTFENAYENFMRLYPFEYTANYDYMFHLGFAIAVGAGILLVFRPSRVPPIVLLWSCWLGGGILLAGILKYSPTRYIIPAFLPALCLAAYGLTVWTPDKLGEKKIRWAFAGLLCLYFLVGNVTSHARWYSGRKHSIENFNKVIAELPEGSVIGGISALFAVAETPHTAVRIDPRRGSWFNKRDPFNRFGVTHLILTPYVGNERRTLSLYKKETSNLTLLRSYHVCGYLYNLYEVGPPASSDT
jgi:4-amino-4-deoxy-L-arabinose transferase-like glycosyltransferase